MKKFKKIKYFFTKEKIEDYLKKAEKHLYCREKRTFEKCCQMFVFANEKIFQEKHNIPIFFIENNNLLNFFIDSVRDEDVKNLTGSLRDKLWLLAIESNKTLSLNLHKIDDDALNKCSSGLIVFPLKSKLENLFFQMLPNNLGDGVRILLHDKNKIYYDICKKTSEDSICNFILLKIFYGFLLYKEVFPEAVKDGFVFDTPKRLLPKGKHISITAHPKIIQSSSHNSPTPHLRRGHFMFCNSNYYKKKQGQFIWRESTFVNGKVKSVVTV